MLKELDKQSLLLLYLADELSVSDRAAVARMLEADAGLRAELANLETAHRLFEESLANLDSTSALPEAGAVRRIGQAMRQHMADQLGKAGKTTGAKHAKSRYPMWAYPSAAAAVIAISFLSWWGHRAETPLRIASPITAPGASTSPTTNFTPSTPDSVATVPPSSTPVASAEESGQPDAEGDNLGEVNLTQPKESVASLYAAEDEVSELARSRSEIFGFSLGNE